MKLILASSSKQRQDIFKMLGLKYEVMTNNVPEESNKKKPYKYVEELSRNKALSVKSQIKEKAIIISCDTIIYGNNKIYEKPKSKEEAYQNLIELSNSKCTAYTGMTILDLYQDKTITTCTKVDIYFNEITDKEAKWYSENEEKIFKCCGFVPLGKASLFIKKINGDYNTLLGISPSTLYSKLKELGYDITNLELENNN